MNTSSEYCLSSSLAVALGVCAQGIVDMPLANLTTYCWILMLSPERQGEGVAHGEA